MIKNTCDFINAEYTVYMNTSDWLDLEAYYSEVDDDGKLMKDSILKECHTHRSKTQWTGCTFIVGKVDTAKYGVTDDLQLSAGWLSGNGNKGVKRYSYKWVKQ